MKLEQAVQSGRPFKRAGWFDYLIINNSNNTIINKDKNQKNIPVVFNKEDILAEDWELLREVSYELTETELEIAVCHALVGLNKEDIAKILKEIKEKLKDKIKG